MKLLCWLMMMSVSLSANALTTFSYVTSTKVGDTRAKYDIALFNLALEKTIVSHGSYQVNPSPKMNLKRAIATSEKNSIENFFFKNSYSIAAAETMAFVNFPVDLGIVGYRVFFVSPQVAGSFSEVMNLEQLKDFSIAQGVGWLDTQILRHSGFKVIEGTSYDGLFKMVARSRIDLFPRGANELLSELQMYTKELPLIADTNTILYYPLPRFFFTSKQNKPAIERIKKGLELAYQDGSLLALWKKYYLESVRFINFITAKIFTIENPYLKGLDDSYQQYVIRPEQLFK